MINHFAVVCSVTWPLNGGDAVRDLVFIETSQFFVVLMLTS